MEAGSCALSQGNATCGLSGADVDATLNVEHELSRWLQDLDAASSVSQPAYIRACVYIKGATENSESPKFI